MASQRDVFSDTASERGSLKGKKVSGSLPNFLYKWVVLFKWNALIEENRFVICERKQFPEIKDSWVNGQLSSNSRAKHLRTLRALPDGTFSLFAKIEEGTDTNRQKNILDNLNLQFSLIVPGKTTEAAYTEVIKTNPYAILAKYSYEVLGKKLDSPEKEYDPSQAITANVEDELEPENSVEREVDELMRKEEDSGKGKEKLENKCVSDSDEDFDEDLENHFETFPNHSELLLKLRNAKLAAEKKNNTAFLVWRGFRTSVFPDGKKVDFSIFKTFLLKALNEIKDPSIQESRVGFIQICFFPENTVSILFLSFSSPKRSNLQQFQFKEWLCLTLRQLRLRR